MISEKDFDTKLNFCYMKDKAKKVIIREYDNQLQQTNAWTIAEGDDAPKIRAGQIVKRDKLSNSLISF